MFNSPAVFVDIETTGASCNSSRIIEVSALKYQDGQITDTFSSLINPDTVIPFFITNITGISSGDVVNAPYFDDVAHDLREFLEDDIFVAHNVGFDYSFIKNQFGELGISYSPQKFCTVKFSRTLYPQFRSHSLENIIKRHNLAVNSRHRSYDDAKALVDFCQIAQNDHTPELLSAAIARQIRT